MTRGWRIFLALCVVILLIVGGWVIRYYYWTVPNHFLESQRPYIDPKEYIQAENNIRTGFVQALIGLAQVVGGAALLGGLYLTLRNIRATERNIEIAQANLGIAQKSADRNFEASQETLRITRESQITERFTQAIEQLGNKDSLAIRLGGIYALERIAKDSEKDHWPVMEVLTTYVRENARRNAGQESLSDSHTVSDIQTILTVIGRREHSFEKYGKRINLDETNLRGVDLTDAHLEKANLRSSILIDAILTHTDLRSAYLGDANLKKAWLHNTNLENADLSSATLVGVTLFAVNLTRANLMYANAEGVIVIGTSLEEADLHKANLKGADLRNAIGLTREQVDMAVIDNKTRLPDYLQPPQPPEQEKTDSLEGS